MQIRTNKGLTYRGQWIGGPTGIRKEIYCEIEDSRALHVIAAEFDNAELTAVKEGGVETTYIGFTELVRISRETEVNVVRIAMRKPDRLEEV